ncbi:hypothetical protein [Nocardioides sp.]|uniref:hypothetical protein n=1 Tax=Nocardioides sp. TaxID=35761 RepID=UPI003D1486B8
MFDVSVADLQGWAVLLTHLDTTVDDAGRIAQLRALEDVQAAACAAQARIAVDFAASQALVVRRYP